MILIYCQSLTPRGRYVFDWISAQWGIKYTLVRNAEEFVTDGCSGIWYDAAMPTTTAVWVSPAGLIDDDSLRAWPVDPIHHNGLPCFFKSDGDLGFDVFSGLFYMLSRYEEYLPFQPDTHGRFPATASAAAQTGCLQIPVADRWVEELRAALLKKFPSLRFSPGHFSARMTYDLDIPFQFAGKTLPENCAAFARDLLTLRWQTAIRRVLFMAGLHKDRWDVFHQLGATNQNLPLQPVFFILSGRSSSFDRGLSLTRGRMQKLIAFLKTAGKIGLHPSYDSGARERIRDEKRKLEIACGQTVTASRQHFLRFRFPDTFLRLIDAGIEEDYSMAFPEAPGFRAGTSKPFFFYDLTSERITPLKIIPSCWMDSTFVNYPHGGTERPLTVAKKLIDEIKAVNGMFIPIFHNYLLGDSNWMTVHDTIVAETLKLTGGQ